jgi:hypothetical protein
VVSSQIIRLPIVFLALVLTACTTITEPTLYVYPTTLNVPRGDIVFSVGSQQDIGVSAMIVGKTIMEPGDSIGVTIRDTTILKRVGDSQGRNKCTNSDGIASVCLGRAVDVKVLKTGVTYIIFRLGGKHSTADSVRIETQISGKG